MADFADFVAGEFRADLAGKVGEREMARLTGVSADVVLNTSGPDGNGANITQEMGASPQMGR